MRNEGSPERTTSSSVVVLFVEEGSESDDESDVYDGSVMSSAQAQVNKSVALIINKHKKLLKNFLSFIFLPRFGNIVVSSLYHTFFIKSMFYCVILNKNTNYSLLSSAFFVDFLLTYCATYYIIVILR